MVEICRLESRDYDQLRNVQEGYRPDPEHSIVCVAKCDGEIIARTMLIRPFHVEGTWVDARFRKGTTGIRLLQRLESEAKAAGLTKIFSYAMEPEIENYLARMGYQKCPVTVWAKEL